MLQKNGKAAGDPLITFDTAVYPIGSDGLVKSDMAGAFLDAPENKSKITALEDFYRKRFWEKGSPVTIVFEVTGMKEAKATKVSNPHWDNDPQFAGKPDVIIATVYEYIKPMLSVQ
jgi:hypothetical protein